MDGNEAFARACVDLGIDAIQLIVRTAKWVDPEVFLRLPIWYPEAWRGAPLFDAQWQKRYTNRSKRTGIEAEKFEANERAQKALKAALDFDEDNWTCCHLWGLDDPKFGQPNLIVQDPRFYSCVANMVLLPTPLKAFTDAVPAIKEMLRVCAFWLYGWACDHERVRELAANVRAGHVPAGYPTEWPAPGRAVSPPGVVKLTPRIAQSIARRVERIELDLAAADARPNYPAARVREVLSYSQRIVAEARTRRLARAG